MDRLRTLLLARTHTVVMDPDVFADAATRPLRDSDADHLEDELAQLGYVMSLDLAMTVRRLPREASQQLRAWIIKTLAGGRALEKSAPYLQRMLGYLAGAAQPCPWCGELKAVGALDPCGHLVCRTCWEGGAYSGCPICQRRIVFTGPFVRGDAASGATLGLLHLGFDLAGSSRDSVAALLARTTPPSAADRADLENLIDAIGPRVLAWLPAHIPSRATMAIAVARLWSISPDRAAIAAATASHLTTATDVLRVAAVLMGGTPELGGRFRLHSIARRLRRSLLEALDRLPLAELAEDMRRHAELWKRVGERLHPRALADRLPNVARAFAIVRGSEPAPQRWRAPIEAALRTGDAAAAAEQLAEQPLELLARADHVARIAHADAVPRVLAAIERAIPSGSPVALLVLASHVSRRGAAWPRRVMLGRRDPLAAWVTDDRRPPLRADVIGAIAGAVRAELVARASSRRHFPRAVIDRALGDLPVSCAGAGWPRGADIALPVGHELRVAIDPAREVAAAGFDADWRHRATSTTPELHLEDLHARGVRHVVLAVRGGSGRLQVGPFAFDLPRARLQVPLAIDLANRHLHWLGVAISDRARAPSLHAMLAHVARDLADLAAARARPTLWDIAAIHAATRANIVYVRERDGAITTFRRRDGEPAMARLSRLMSGSGEDGRATAIPAANAPTWFALVHADLALPAGSVGYHVDGVAAAERLSIAALIAELV